MASEEDQEVFNYLTEETPDEKMFRENEEFYEKHPLESLILKDSGYDTVHGRNVYLDQFGSYHSEITETQPITFTMSDGTDKNVYINIPRIFEGKIVSTEEALDILQKNNWIDPESNENIKLSIFDSVEEAVESSKKRMKTFNQDQPWMQYGPEEAIKIYQSLE
jgi:hypothetical protein